MFFSFPLLAESNLICGTGRTACWLNPDSREAAPPGQLNGISGFKPDRLILPEHANNPARIWTARINPPPPPSPATYRSVKLHLRSPKLILAWREPARSPWEASWDESNEHVAEHLRKTDVMENETYFNIWIIQIRRNGGQAIFNHQKFLLHAVTPSVFSHRS